MFYKHCLVFVSFFLFLINCKTVAEDYVINRPHTDSNINENKLNEIIAKAKKYLTSDLIIAKDGKIILEMRTDTNRASVEVMSITKSFSSLAIGLLLDEGLLSTIDTPVYKIYPEWDQGRKRQITIRHLLSHTSGIQTDRESCREIYVALDTIQLALSSDLESNPGEQFIYNNKATNLLAGIVRKLSGKNLDEYLAEKLFRPLGITDFSWYKDSYGNPLGMAGLHIHHTDLLKIGQLLLNNGNWNGKQIISQKWLEESFKPSQSFDPSCGLLWWLLRNEENRIIGYAAKGYKGQFLVVLPEKRIVAVRQFDHTDFPEEDDEVSLEKCRLNADKVVFQEFPLLLTQLTNQSQG